MPIPDRLPTHYDPARILVKDTNKRLLISGPDFPEYDTDMQNEESKTNMEPRQCRLTILPEDKVAKLMVDVEIYTYGGTYEFVKNETQVIVDSYGEKISRIIIPSLSEKFRVFGYYVFTKDIVKIKDEQKAEEENKQPPSKPPEQKAVKNTPTKIISNYESERRGQTSFRDSVQSHQPITKDTVWATLTKERNRQLITFGLSSYQFRDIPSGKRVRIVKYPKDGYGSAEVYIPFSDEPRSPYSNTHIPISDLTPSDDDPTSNKAAELRQKAKPEVEVESKKTPPQPSSKPSEQKSVKKTPAKIVMNYDTERDQTSPHDRSPFHSQGVAKEVAITSPDRPVSLEGQGAKNFAPYSSQLRYGA